MEQEINSLSNRWSTILYDESSDELGKCEKKMEKIFKDHFPMGIES